MRVVFTRQGRSKQGHEAIAQKLINGPFVAMHLGQRHFKEVIQEGVHGLGAQLLSHGGGIGKIAKQHRDLLPFALQRTAGAQDFLGKVLWGIGSWSVEPRGGGTRCMDLLATLNAKLGVAGQRSSTL